MKILGFIPARSGSTRLKNKNLKKFLGKPLLYHTVNFVKKLKLNHILVSSDSRKIKNIELQFNILNDDYLRPRKLSNKDSQLTDAIFDALNWLLINKKKKFDAVMVFQPTTPYRDLIETKKIIRLFKKNKLESLATVSKVDEHPQFIYRVFKGKKWDYMLKKRVNSLNKQDLE